QPPGLARLEPTGAELNRRCRARGDRPSERVLERRALETRGQERRQQHVAGADDRDRLDERRGRAEATAAPPLLAQERETAALVRDQDVAGAELREVVEREREVLLVVEVLADDRL